MRPLLETFVRFLRLGCTSFGGPLAHLGYFRREFVERAGWLDDAAFKEIVALCSILPGPTSSQVGIVIGARRAGPLGGALAWFAFTAPSALLLGAFGSVLHGAARRTGSAAQGSLAGVLEGLAAAAAAVVFVAVVQMARTLVRSRAEIAIAALALLVALACERYAPAFQWTAVILGAGLGAAFVRSVPGLPSRAPALAIPRRIAFACGGAFAVLLVLLPLLAPPGSVLELFASMYRAGALVFGGGHVVLPFLAAFIGPAVNERTFFAGYGAAQAMPGPLFAFSAFLGAADRTHGGPATALVALLGIYLPSFLLIAAVMPLWSALRQLPRSNDVLAGVNAAVVGLLAAIFLDPIALSLAHDPLGIVLAAVSVALLLFTRLPAWAPAVLCAATGFALRAGSLTPGR